MCILSFFCYKVKVRYTVWARISVGSVQFRFVGLSSSSSFVDFPEFQRVRHFVRRVLLPLELAKLVFTSNPEPYCLFFADFVLAFMVAGGQVRRLVWWFNLRSFLVEST